jgi:diguanylate cyclase (GGDEF)-like protein
VSTASQGSLGQAASAVSTPPAHSSAAAVVATSPASVPVTPSGSLSRATVPVAVSGVPSGAHAQAIVQAPAEPAISPAPASPTALRIASRTARIPVGRSAGATHTARPAGSPAASTATRPSVIQHFVRVVPEAIWIVLCVALTLAATAGSVALRTSRRARRQAGEFAAVAAAAHTDPLTGALNRRAFTEAVERELARARRYRSTFVMAYFDVRGLKGLNDTSGHGAGDMLLREVAELLQDSAREADVVARIGGDEFALLMTEQPAHSGRAVTSRIRGRVAERRAAMKLDVPWDLTAGTASYPEDGETFEHLLAAADRRLYEQRGIELVASRRSV